MNICIGLFHFFPAGGLTRDMMSIARLLKQAGHSVRIFCFKNSAPDFEFEIDVELISVSAWSNAGKVQQFVQTLASEDAFRQADLRLGFNKMPGLDAYYAADGCIREKYQNRLGRFTKRIKTYLQFEDAVFSKESNCFVLAISSVQLAIYKEQYQLADDRYTLLPPGIDRSRVYDAKLEELRQTMRASLGVDGELLLLFVGSGFRTKGLDRAIKITAAINKLRPAKLVVAGEDKKTAFAAQAKAAGIGERVVFLGGRTDIPELINAADILLHPAYWENTGTVLLEAMLGALPVVSTPSCGYSQYITEQQFGFIAPAEGLLSEAGIKSILALADQRAHFISKALELAGEPYWFSQHQQALDCLSELAVHRGRAR